MYLFIYVFTSFFGGGVSPKAARNTAAPESCCHVKGQPMGNYAESFRVVLRMFPGGRAALSNPAAGRQSAMNH